MEYLKFLKGDFINYVDETHIKLALENINGSKHSAEAKCFLVYLYYTGARPSELLELKGKDVIKKGKYYHLALIGKKRGNSRMIILKNNELTKIAFNHVSNVFPDFYLFSHFKSNRTYTTKYHLKDGTPKEKSYSCNSYIIKYHFQKWFKDVVDIPLYFLRHNRISKLASEGISLTDLQQFKGSKTLASIQPYIHVSTHTAKRIASKNK